MGTATGSKAQQIELPLIATRVKEIRKEYGEAMWSEDEVAANKLRNELENLIRLDQLGEKYIIPF